MEKNYGAEIISFLVSKNLLSKKEYALLDDSLFEYKKKCLEYTDPISGETFPKCHESAYEPQRLFLPKGANKVASIGFGVCLLCILIGLATGLFTLGIAVIVGIGSGVSLFSTRNNKYLALYDDWGCKVPNELLKIRLSDLIVSDAVITGIWIVIMFSIGTPISEQIRDLSPIFFELIFKFICEVALLFGALIIARIMIWSKGKLKRELADVSTYTINLDDKTLNVPLSCTSNEEIEKYNAFCLHDDSMKEDEVEWDEYIDNYPEYMANPYYVFRMVRVGELLARYGAKATYIEKIAELCNTYDKGNYEGCVIKCREVLETYINRELKAFGYIHPDIQEPSLKEKIDILYRFNPDLKNFTEYFDMIRISGNKSVHLNQNFGVYRPLEFIVYLIVICSLGHDDKDVFEENNQLLNYYIETIKRDIIDQDPSLVMVHTRQLMEQFTLLFLGALNVTTTGGAENTLETRIKILADRNILSPKDVQSLHFVRQKANAYAHGTAQSEPFENVVSCARYVCQLVAGPNKAVVNF